MPTLLHPAMEDSRAVAYLGDTVAIPPYARGLSGWIRW